jgi:hypothetical protein
MRFLFFNMSHNISETSLDILEANNLYVTLWSTSRHFWVINSIFVLKDVLLITISRLIVNHIKLTEIFIFDSVINNKQQTSTNNLILYNVFHMELHSIKQTLT